MPVNPFNHLDLRVVDMGLALPFYQSLLPALGFTHGGSHHEPTGVQWQVFALSEGKDRPSQFVAIIEDKSHKPNRNCIAFYVETRDGVDEVGEIVKAAGGRSIEGPEFCPEYRETYYAVFFEDPSGNRLEAVNWM